MVHSYGKLQTLNPRTRKPERPCDRYPVTELYACVGILESELRYIKIRQPATIKILGAADEIRGWVADISPFVNDNGIINLTIKLGDQHGLLPGMNVVASIRDSIADRLIIPKEAIVVHGDSSVVFTMREGKSIWNYVALGEDNGREIEVLRGLNAGDRVIISNNTQLTQDSPVKEW